MRENEEKNKIVGGTLYLVATPIGNMADISERAVKTLREVDFVAAEDTRNSLRLLTCLGIRQTFVSYHEHNRRRAGEEIAARLLAGESCALVTDAGMPAISDPGADLVALCAEKGIPVTIVPGCCAAVSALALSGLDTRRFVFEGFLPVPSGERKKRLADLQNERRTMILYEAPHKLRATLSDLSVTFGPDRKLSVCRELTKLNEEIQRSTVGEVTAFYTDHEPRGEYVLILEGKDDAGTCETPAGSPTASLSPEEKVAWYCRTQGFSRMDAIKAAAREMGIPKSELYRRLNHDGSGAGEAEEP